MFDVPENTKELNTQKIKLTVEVEPTFTFTGDMPITSTDGATLMHTIYKEKFSIFVQNIFF